MGEYMFGVVTGGRRMRGLLRGKAGKEIDRIAQEHGAEFIGPVSIPGNEDMAGWFTCPNRGSPFDRDTQRLVVDAVQAAGYGWIWGEQ